jgi:hypothetical protein
MKKYLFLFVISSAIFCCVVVAQPVKLSALFDVNNSAVKLNWNMVNSNTTTGYFLLRSDDGINWTEVAKDRMPRNYTDQDIYIFNDRNYFSGKNYYRIRIANTNNQTIALSTIVTVNTTATTAINKTQTAVRPPPNTQAETKNITQSNKTSSSSNTGINSWIIYPNPATDVLKLAYRGQGEIKGVVNVQIQDANGKTVIKFRSGSMYKNIEIPISNLRRGAYFIQVTVLNELMMNQQFIKQ